MFRFDRIILVIGLIVGFSGILHAQTVLQAPAATMAEPTVYRVRSQRIEDIRRQLLATFHMEPDFNVTIHPEKEADFYRIHVIASSGVHRRIPEILTAHGILLPKGSGRTIVSIESTSATPVPPVAQQAIPVPNVASRMPAFPSVPPDQPAIQSPPASHPPITGAPVTTPLAFSTPVLPNVSPTSPPAVPSITTSPTDPFPRTEESVLRDSYTPTTLSLGLLEEKLRGLLAGRLNEMSPGRYLLTIEKNQVLKQCTLEIDRNNNRLLIVGERSICDQVVQLVDALDRPEPSSGRQRQFIPIRNARIESIARILDINRASRSTPPDRQIARPDVPIASPFPAEPRKAEPVKREPSQGPTFQSPAPRLEFRQHQSQRLPLPRQRADGGTIQTAKHLHPSRNPVIQLVGYTVQDGGMGDFGGGGIDPMGVEGGTPGMEVVSDFRYQILPDLDVLIIDATGAEVARFKDMIKQIEELSQDAQPKLDVYYLKHVNCVSLNWVIGQIYNQGGYFRMKQGMVGFVPMIHPNAILLIGWGDAMEAAKDLIETLDKPVAEEHSLLHIFRLKNASAQYAITVLRGTFPPAGAMNSAFLPRVQLYADTRTNTVIAQGGPNDLKMIERIINEIDVPGAGPKLQVKAFKLKHTLVADLEQVINRTIAAGVAGTPDQKKPGLELLIEDEKGRRIIESGIMTDVRLARDDQSNRLLVTAPEHCMTLLEELIEMLDVPTATAEVKIFQILYGEAASMVLTLRSLLPTQLEGTVGPQLPGAQDEDTFVPIRFAVDSRTNSILAAGAPNDLKTIEALIMSLDREDQQVRRTEVYFLKSMLANDVALAINAYIEDKLRLQQQAPGVVSAYQQIESASIVIAESVSNSLIVSATPRYYEEIMQLIREIDKSPPQVAIQVLIGEVTLSNADEFGAEFGFQDSLLFNRSTFENIQQGTRTITKTLADGTRTVIEEPIILNGNINPGWLFNEAPGSSLGDGYNTNSANSAGNVGSQLLTNFGTGRVGAETGFGGMVFSANSDAVSIMIRALKETNRLEVLSRPMITAMNNQSARIHVGQDVPRVMGTRYENNREVTDVEDKQVGLLLVVTPNISPEGDIVMDVQAMKSKLSASDGTVVGFAQGQPVRSPAIDTITTQTSIRAANNETVVLGGMITKEDQQLNRRVPLLSDIPLVGKLFQYKYNKCRRTELLFIMTPKIVSTQNDMDEFLRVESARMSWCLGNVAKLHGDIGSYDVISETPYVGDSTILFPEAVDVEGLTPLKDMPQPTLAPTMPEDEQKTQQKVPTPVLPKK